MSRWSWRGAVLCLAVALAAMWTDVREARAEAYIVYPGVHTKVVAFVHSSDGSGVLTPDAWGYVGTAGGGYGTPPGTVDTTTHVPAGLTLTNADPMVFTWLAKQLPPPGTHRPMVNLNVEFTITTTTCTTTGTECKVDTSIGLKEGTITTATSTLAVVYNKWWVDSIQATELSNTITLVASSVSTGSTLVNASQIHRAPPTPAPGQAPTYGCHLFLSASGVSTGGPASKLSLDAGGPYSTTLSLDATRAASFSTWSTYYKRGAANPSTLRCLAFPSTTSSGASVVAWGAQWTVGTITIGASSPYASGTTQPLTFGSVAWSP